MALILVTGGARSGKSEWAMRRASALAEASGGNVLFVATAEAKELAMRLRVAQLRKNRPRAWKTIEAPRAIAAQLLQKARIEPGTVLILDCVTSLVQNVMADEKKSFADATQIEQAVQAELRAVLRITKERKATLILVTNEVGGGLEPEDDRNRQYREAVGALNQWLAAQAEGVWLTVSGMVLPLHTLAVPVSHEVPQ